jgi:hypothetical protein
MKTGVAYESRQSGVQWMKNEDGVIRKRMPGSGEWTFSAATEFLVDMCVCDGFVFEVK